MVGELLQHLLAKFADVIVRRLPPLSKGGALQARLSTAHLRQHLVRRGPRTHMEVGWSDTLQMEICELVEL